MKSGWIRVDAVRCSADAVRWTVFHTDLFRENFPRKIKIPLGKICPGLRSSIQTPCRPSSPHIANSIFLRNLEFCMITADEFDVVRCSGNAQCYIKACSVENSPRKYKILPRKNLPRTQRSSRRSLAGRVPPANSVSPQPWSLLPMQCRCSPMHPNRLFDKGRGCFLWRRISGSRVAAATSS